MSYRILDGTSYRMSYRTSDGMLSVLLTFYCMAGFRADVFFYRILDETSYRTFHRMVCQLFHWKIHRMFSAGQVCDDVPQSDTCDQTPPSDTPPSDTTPVNSAGAVQTFLTHLSHPCQTTYGLMKHLTRRHISC